MDYSDDLRNPKKFNDLVKRDISPIKYNFSTNDFVVAIHIIGIRYNQLHEWNPAYMSTPLNPLIDVICEIARNFYPEAVRTSNLTDTFAVCYADLLPLLLKEIAVDKKIDPLIEENLNNLEVKRFKFASDRIHLDALKYLSLLVPNKNFLSPSEPSTPNSFSLSKRDMSLSEDSRDTSKYSKDDIEVLANLYGEKILHDCETKGYQIVISLLSSSKADNFVLYKSDSIHSKKDYTIEDNFKYIFVEPEGNSYNGYYTVAKYPLSQYDYKFGDTLILYDFRDKKKFL